MKRKSEFHTAVGDDSHTCLFEFVPNARKPRAIYVVFDGQRIAHRGDPSGPHRGTWVPMIPGFEVFDGEDGNTVAVTYRGAEVH